MTSAKITRCRHYFHGVCLRKWLYVQDRCPLCHEIIMHQETAAVSTTNDSQQDENQNTAGVEPDDEAVEAIEENVNVPLM